MFTDEHASPESAWQQISIPLRPSAHGQLDDNTCADQSRQTDGGIGMQSSQASVAFEGDGAPNMRMMSAKRT